MIEEATGTTPEIVLQDFHAKVFAECLTEALILDVREEVTAYNKGKKRAYMICTAQALAKMKNVFVLLFWREDPTELIMDLRDVFVKNLTAIVPGRKARRKRAGKTILKYKLPSRAYKMNR